MTSQATPPPPFARFGGFGFSSRTREAKKKSGEDEDWYIPYNGPYEAPREPPPRHKARDSWGDPVDGYDDTLLADRELHLRYGGHDDFAARNSGGAIRPVEEERKGRSRDRTFSVISGRTVSSGAVDPGRASMGTQRRSTVSSANPPPVPTYISIDPVGGVGESPVPRRRSSKDGNRISLASIFSFGGTPRKPVAAPSAGSRGGLSSNVSRKLSQLQRPGSSSGHEKSYRIVESPALRHSSSSEFASNSIITDKHQHLHQRLMQQSDRLSSTGTEEEDYYNSYYSTLLSQPPAASFPQDPSPPPSVNSHRSLQPRHGDAVISRKNSTSPTSAHPYAYAFPRTEILDGPQTAPLIPTPHTPNEPGPSNPPRLTFTTPLNHHPSSADAPNFSFSRPTGQIMKQLKNSTSTPNLRNSSNPPTQTVNAAVLATNNRQGMVPPAFVFPKGKDRWLSAETWCDALLFPRPRLKVRQEMDEGTYSGSGRIVSPPGTPLAQGFGAQVREPGFASRVLTHSRSLVDLHKSAGISGQTRPPIPSTSQIQDSSRGGPQARAPRPMSFAQDDLSLPTPVPSLARVLQEGEQLHNDRMAWQLQAENSFGNKRARSVSRTRSKSLTQKGRRRGHQHQSSMEYLAAQACLGTQNLTPTIVAQSNYFAETTQSTVTSSGRGFHSHANSLVKTLSKSSKSHSRNHSRSDSWSKSAIKMAKSTVGICGYPTNNDDVSVNHANLKAASLEGAIKRDGTKVIRLADPAHLPVDRGLPVNGVPYDPFRKSPSPSSGLSDSRVGIALGTPPPDDDDRDSIYLPSHPYAQGGLSFSNGAGYSSNDSRQERGSDFAGPHPSVTAKENIPQISEILARHKLPPHIALHPYAQATPRDSYLDKNGLIGQYRADGDGPHPSKMWAQLSPGVVREILPGDIQYSPFMSDNESDSPVSASGHPIRINDTVGVGEALVQAARYRESQDSGLGTSEDHTIASKQNYQPIQLADSEVESENSLPEFGPRVRRKPVPYNDIRPVDLADAGQKLSDPSTNHTLSSSLLEVHHETARAESHSPAVTSESSSPQHSPRILASPNDMESFQDLFYRPNNMSRKTPTEAALPETPSPPHASGLPWDITMRNRRTGSGLTSLARQLSEEFENITSERERTNSQYSQSNASTRQQSGVVRRPADGNLQFVFEEGLQPESPIDDVEHTIHAFKPSSNLPEDVESSRASSLMEKEENEDEDDTAMFRVGMVESVSTPPIVPSQHRSSYTGETSFVNDRHDPSRDSAIAAEVHARILSGLQPPLTEATRSSYMTTSTVSRMSGLSDFPAPPPNAHLTPKHMSLLSSYFDEALTQSETRTSPLPPPPVLLEAQRVTFGKNQDADTLAKTLSQPPF